MDTLGDKIRRGGYRQISHVLRRVDLETVNETVAHVKTQVLVDTGRHTSTSRDRRTWQHTSKFGAYVLVDTLADKLAEVEFLTLNETLARMKAHACPHTHLQASRGEK